ncbi:MAG: hypothetical protein WCF47_20225, partial [Pseudolabrys sp.]
PTTVGDHGTASVPGHHSSKKSVRLSGGPTFRIVGFPFFHFGKVTVGALQLFTPLAAVFVVGPPCHACALFSLLSKEFRRSHIQPPEFPAFALQHF